MNEAKKNLSEVKEIDTHPSEDVLPTLNMLHVKILEMIKGEKNIPLNSFEVKGLGLGAHETSYWPTSSYRKQVSQYIPDNPGYNCQFKAKGKQK